MTRFEPGDTAPDFTLPDAQGNDVSLSDFRGSRVVVYFYPAAMTPGCTTQACDFRDSLDALTAQGITVLGISPDKPEKLAQFAERDGLTFPLLSDADKSVMTAWGAFGEKKALQAVPGQRVALNPPQKLYARPESARRQLLIADEPALPAALRIAELTGRQVETTVLVELRGRENALRTEHGEEDPTTYRWLCGTGNGATPSQLLETLRREKLEHDTYVWVAGETRLTREARSYLRHELGLPAEAYKCVGYWTDKAEQWRERYDALGEEFHERLRALYACELDEEEIVDEVQRMYEAVGL